MTYTLPRVAATVALAGAIWYVYPSFLWVQKPKTLDPEFVAEAKRIGNVAVRTEHLDDSKILDHAYVLDSHQPFIDFGS